MSTLCTLQEEQVRLKMRLQELQQLKRELRNSPKDKVSRKMTCSLFLICKVELPLSFV
uniref:Uncharacterized protein n=1 Tax=Spermophilus dauricus TaxID=99837 RepID=A0A8C9Q1A9_SPEDA